MLLLHNTLQGKIHIAIRNNRILIFLLYNNEWCLTLGQRERFVSLLLTYTCIIAIVYLS